MKWKFGYVTMNEWVGLNRISIDHSAYVHTPHQQQTIQNIQQGEKKNYIQVHHYDLFDKKSSCLLNNSLDNVVCVYVYKYDCNI